MTRWNASVSATPLDATVVLVESETSILRRKIWLPRIAYTLLPYFYFGSGLAAFLGTLYINEWFWVLPHYVLFSAACIHFGIAVANKRRNAAREQESRRRSRPADPDVGANQG